MKFEVIEDAGGWIVRRDGVELGRFRDQDAALADIAAHLRACSNTAFSYSLAVRYLVPA
jgi:hypothetical protein